MNTAIRERVSGVWSAAPTPLNEDRVVDVRSVERMVRHHRNLAVNGLFLAGTCGEGAMMPPEEKRRLVRSTVEAANGNLVVAVQVSENSVPNILGNIRQVQEDGADVAVVGAPASFENPEPERICAFYEEVIEQSPLPVGLYDLGDRREFSIPADCLEKLYSEPNVLLVKDSSTDPARRDIALKARRGRPELKLFNGDEFHCVEYLNAGYDGLMLGGGVFNGYIAGMILNAVGSGDLDEAEELQERMTKLMYAVYGGPEIRCWLGGLKHLLAEMGVFSTALSFTKYPLTDDCREAIKEILETERDLLFPVPDGKIPVRFQ